MKLSKPSVGNPTQGYKATHRAIDYGWGNGKTVTAAAPGTLTYSRVFGYGLRAKIAHEDGSYTTYSHLEKILKSGDVSRGTPIAVMGNSGAYAVGVHLHFEYWLKGVRVNPESYYTDFAGGGGTKPPTPIKSDTERRKKITWLG